MTSAVVHTQSMPVLCLILKGSSKTEVYRIPAIKIEDAGKTITLKDKDGNTIGSFDKPEFAGWWIEQDDAISGSGTHF